MPHLRFYAEGDDHRAIIDTVFAQGEFAVYEMHAENAPVRRFDEPAAVPATPYGTHLMLHVTAAGGRPLLDRDVIGGWGLIQLSFGTFFGGHELRWSTTNHNSATRAQKWAGSYPEYGDPRDWDWREISRASGRLNRRIRSLAVDTVGPHPVLPDAGELIRRHRLTHVYGTGIHDRPPPGLL